VFDETRKVEMNNERRSTFCTFSAKSFVGWLSMRVCDRWTALLGLLAAEMYAD
jgi:hypothetical protein